jgi:alpha-ketoglutarate-dependent taurine dioxygenase
MKKTTTSCLWFSSLIIVLLAIFLQIIPAKYLLLPYMRLPKQSEPTMFLSDLKTFKDPLPSRYLNQDLTVHIGPLNFILIIEPSNPLEATAEIERRGLNATYTIADWYTENKEWFETNLVKYGGILLRNFPLYDIYAFDEVISRFHRSSRGTGIYLGTAPRQKMSGTRFVSTASDIPSLITIPTHIELSFTPNPPQRLYFYSDKTNNPPGGQTTYSDFKGVWKDLSKKTKDTLLSRGMTIERRYHNGNQMHPIDIMVTKSWQEMFKTDDKFIANELAFAQDFTPIWDENDNLMLKHEQLIIRNHTITEQPYWATHFNVLHAETYEIPYAWSAQLFNSKTSLMLSYFFVCLYTIRIKLLGLPYGHNMVWTDTETSVENSIAMEIRRTIMKNTWIFDWKENDMMILDNHRIAHGRSPWFDMSERKVYVAWN